MNGHLIIPNIVENLRNWLKIEANWEHAPEFKEHDGLLFLKFNGKAEKFTIEAKKEVKKQTLPQIFHYKEIYPDLILLANTIYPDVRKTLQEQNINYVDGGGNMYIKTDKNFFLIEGNKPKKDNLKFKGRLFEKTGLKILFALLINENLLNRPYREIAVLTGTALGAVNYVINEMKIEGYALNVNDNLMKMNKKNELLNNWINGYDQKLKRNIFIGRFRIEHENWKHLHFKRNGTLWGGEPAAEILTHYLHPEIFTIYTKETTTDLIKNYRLIPDEKGNVIVNTKFWNMHFENKRDTVPPLLVYADLVNTAIPRNIETAKIIYERYLKDKFE